MDGVVYNAICANRGFTNSQLFDSVYDSTRHDLMLVFCFKKGRYHFNLYSDKSEIDCGKIAKTFGGGGHKGAAGFHSYHLPFLLKG